MPRYVGSVSSPMAREAVFDYLADFASVARWDPSVTEARALEPGRPGRGARFLVVVRALGRETPYVYETIQFERPDLLVLRAETERVISLDTISFAAAGTGTRLTYDARLELKGPMRLLGPPMRIGFRRLAERAKAGLERELAAGPRSPGPLR
jgi:Polyketide cyclase / dehydrase and lipid transport